MKEMSKPNLLKGLANILKAQPAKVGGHSVLLSPEREAFGRILQSLAPQNVPTTTQPKPITPTLITPARSEIPVSVPASRVKVVLPVTDSQIDSKVAQKVDKTSLPEKSLPEFAAIRVNLSPIRSHYPDVKLTVSDHLMSRQEPMVVSYKSDMLLKTVNDGNEGDLTHQSGTTTRVSKPENPSIQRVVQSNRESEVLKETQKFVAKPSINNPTAPNTEPRVAAFKSVDLPGIGGNSSEEIITHRHSANEGVRRLEKQPVPSVERSIPEVFTSAVKMTAEATLKPNRVSHAIDSTPHKTADSVLNEQTVQPNRVTIGCLSPKLAGRADGAQEKVEVPTPVRFQPATRNNFSQSISSSVVEEITQKNSATAANPVLPITVFTGSDDPIAKTIIGNAKTELKVGSPETSKNPFTDTDLKHPVFQSLGKAEQKNSLQSAFNHKEVLTKERTVPESFIPVVDSEVREKSAPDTFSHVPEAKSGLQDKLISPKSERSVKAVLKPHLNTTPTSIVPLAESPTPQSVSLPAESNTSKPTDQKDILRLLVTKNTEPELAIEIAPQVKPTFTVKHSEHVFTHQWQINQIMMKPGTNSFAPSPKDTASDTVNVAGSITQMDTGSPVRLDSQTDLTMMRETFFRKISPRIDGPIWHSKFASPEITDKHSVAPSPLLWDSAIKTQIPLTKMSENTGKPALVRKDARPQCNDDVKNPGREVASSKDVVSTASSSTNTATKPDSSVNASQPVATAAGEVKQTQSNLTPGKPADTAPHLPTTPQPVFEARDLLSTIKNQVSTNGHQKIEMTLRPEALGKATALIEKVGDLLKLEFKVENSESRLVMEAETTHLRETLAAAGYNNVSIEFSVSTPPKNEADAHTDPRQQRDQNPEGQRKSKDDDRDEPRRRTMLTYGYNSFDLVA